MTTTTTYQYEPLPAGCQTRILELLPSQDRTAGIRARLVDIDIYRHYDFKALSYTWGGQDFTEPITISDNSDRHNEPDDCASVRAGDRLMLITLNLHDALVRFRDRHEVCRIWVDALCINQQDDHEKAKQVPFMAQIYRTASRVLVWLGDYEDGGASLTAINTASRQLEAIGVEQLLHTHIHALTTLPWFTRRWVVQEVVLNANVDMYCGQTAWISWFRLVEAVQHLGYFDSELNFKSLAMMATLAEAHRVRVKDDVIPNTGVLDVLTSFSELECGVPHDRIYALAGLASDVGVKQPGQHSADDDSAGIHVDYDEDVEQVYIDLVANNLKNLSGHAQILRLASQRSDGTHLGERCSWAPDWRLRSARNDLIKAKDPGSIGLSLKNAKVRFEHDRKVMRLSFPEEFDYFGDATGFTPYAGVDYLSEVFDSNADDHEVAIWVRKTWMFLLKTLSSMIGGFELSSVNRDNLLTQYERLLLERVDPLQHLKESDYYDSYMSSGEFVRLVCDSADMDQPSSRNNSSDQALLATIRQTMQGRCMFLGKVLRPLPPRKKRFSFPFFGSSPSQPAAESTWPVIGVAASYTQRDDIVFVREVGLRSWRLVACTGNFRTTHGGGRSSEYGYFESQRASTFLLRPVSSPFASEVTVANGFQARLRIGEDEQATGALARQALVEPQPTSDSQHGSDPGMDHEEEEEEQEQQQHYFYIGECKTTRLLEVQPKGDKLNTMKFAKQVNQKRARMQTILLR
ncbi:HET domain-containing protein [Microdochium nivale]|nr:HET domain-containing protein [Microdochium nivale]